MGRTAEWFFIAILTSVAAAISLGAAFGPSVEAWGRQPDSVYFFLGLLVIVLVIVPIKAGFSLSRHRKAKEKAPRYIASASQMISLFSVLSVGGVFALHQGRPWPMYEERWTWLLEATQLMPDTQTSSASPQIIQTASKTPPKTLGLCTGPIVLGAVASGTDQLDRIPECLTRRDAARFGLDLVSSMRTLLAYRKRPDPKAELFTEFNKEKALLYSKYSIEARFSKSDPALLPRLTTQDRAFAKDAVALMKTFAKINAELRAERTQGKPGKDDAEALIAKSNAIVWAHSQKAMESISFEKSSGGYVARFNGQPPEQKIPEKVVWEDGAWRFELRE